MALLGQDPMVFAVWLVLLRWWFQFKHLTKAVMTQMGEKNWVAFLCYQEGSFVCREIWNWTGESVCGVRRSVFSEYTLIDCLATGQCVRGAVQDVQRMSVPSRNSDLNWGRAWRYTQMDKSQLKAMYKEGWSRWEMKGGPEGAAFWGAVPEVVMDSGSGTQG